MGLKKAGGELVAQPFQLLEAARIPWLADPSPPLQPLTSASALTCTPSPASPASLSHL